MRLASCVLKNPLYLPLSEQKTGSWAMDFYLFCFKNWMSEGGVSPPTRSWRAPKVWYTRDLAHLGPGATSAWSMAPHGA